MSKPAVSVVIPAYNACRTIGAALDSVAAQRVGVHEIIVVDDASTDRTAAVVAAWAARVSAQQLQCDGLREGTVRVVRLRANSGPAAARNRGLTEATGEWIAFLDADDAWLPWRLEHQLDLAHRCPDAVLLCGDVIPLAQDGTTEWRCPDQERPSAATGAARQIPLELLAVCNPIATSTVLVRRDAVAAVGGFDARFRGPEDYDLWLRLAADHVLVHCGAPLARYRGGTGGLSMDDRRFLPQVLGVVEKAYGPGGVLSGRKGKRKAQAYQLLSCSWMAAERGAWVRAFGLFARSLPVWPGSFGPHAQLPWGRIRLLHRLCRTALGCRTYGV